MISVVYGATDGSITSPTDREGEGEIGGGEEFVELSCDPHGFRVTEIARPYARGRADMGIASNGR